LDDLTSRIYQRRLRLTLALLDRLQLPDGARALDLGAGAGLASLALARRGLHVEAMDVSQAMVEQIVSAAIGLKLDVRAQTGDAAALPFPDDHFDFVVALGLLPWVRSPRDVLSEITRGDRTHGSRPR